MNKLTIYISAVTLVILLAVSARFWAVSGELQAVSTRIEQQTQQFNQTLSKEVQTVSGELKAVGAKVEQQTLLFNRALGKELLVQLPPDVEGAIKEVEDQLRTESKWPTAAATVQQLNERLTGTLDKLPPWAQEELLPRLLPRRWEINALWILANAPPKDLDGLSSYVRTVETHVSSKPAGSSDELAKRLAARRQDAEKSLTAAERAVAIEAANRAIKERKNLETAFRLVAAYEDEEAKKLVTQLNQILLSRTIIDAIDGLRAELKSYETLTDAGLRAYAVARANQATMDLRLRAKSANLADAALNARLDELEKTVAADIVDANKKLLARDAERSMRYQVWALNQIKQVRTYSAIKEIEIKKIASAVDRNNPMSAAITQAKKTAGETLRKEMIERLAPIDQRVLDEAVSQWFRKVYQQRFADLDETEQLAVVTGFATTVKKLPD